ncbi:hypothetical protein P153DRAFT_347097 [Dothidotthia symphoricarpi CBS 119687]|uniref:Cupredoxin n=1 Tax=Dothidotthia symphoricarpi CBS 119687 TaxID=1392245 RepID=A0A6A6A4Q0_9PLEO|nr:uncharacterized protein P153DRAFT_347097 [Dothidotthia symphoricarpi CBS 119687]KAF2126145.1 hypothetical protein P153DRAFT_347097 [Dothidotthia symphoricarpi CBS 119687]
MHFSTIFAATALAGAAIAEEHFVAVSNKTGSLVFQPDNVKAAEGDTVTFRFWPKNHSVAQGAFGSPCQPLDTGFWSGYVPTVDTQNVANWTFTYEVKNASVPIWYYCTQGKHCQNGMVGVINGPASGAKTLEAYRNVSKNAENNVSPNSKAGTGGNLKDNSTSTNLDTTGAASHLSGSLIFAGLAGTFAYLLM